MAIVKPENMNFSNKNIIFILSGTPGVGKTTTALSAEGVLLIDADNGICRVNPQHRKDASICKTYEEVLEDVKAAKGQYKTIVIDTGGALIEMMKSYVIRHPEEFPGGAQKTVAVLSQKGYGYIKQLFLDFSAELRKDFNVIYLFHEQKSKEDDVTTYEIICEGSAKTLVYQPADLAAHMFIQNGKRLLGFTPTEQYFAKGAYGISGIVEVPTLAEGEPNDFLTKLFAKIRDGLQSETEKLSEDQKLYNKLISESDDFIGGVNNPEDIAPTLEIIEKMPDVLTYKAEIKAKLKKRIKELGIVFDKSKKEYVLSSAK